MSSNYFDLYINVTQKKIVNAPQFTKDLQNVPQFTDRNCQLSTGMF